MAYTSKLKIENFLQINIDDSIAGYVTDWINWVTRYIDNYTKTTFESAAATKHYDCNGGSRMIIDDFTAITTLEFLDQDGNVDETLTATDYWEYPLNDTAKHEIRLDPYGNNSIFPIGSRRLKVTATFGVENTVPPDIEWAATKMVCDIIKQHSDVAKGVKAETLGEYSVTYGDIGSLLEKSGDRDGIVKILDNYRVPTINSMD